MRVQPDRPHWSYSQLTAYLRCPLQYYFQYVLGLKRRFTPSGLALGSAVHAALAAHHRGIQSGQPLQAKEIETAFLEAWQEKRTFEVIQYGDSQTEEAVINQGVALLQAYLNSEQPPQEIIAVEKELVAPIHDSTGEYLEKPLIAVIDLMARQQDSIKITDFKTSSRAYSELEANTSLQGTCYVHAAFESLGELPSFEYVVLIKTKTPRVQHVAVERTPTDFGRLGGLVKTVDRAVEAGIFYPIESPLNCSGCSFYPSCREWGTQPQLDTAAETNRAERVRETSTQPTMLDPV